MDRGKVFTIFLIALPIIALIIGGSTIIILINSLQDKPPTIYNPTHSDLNASIPIQIDVTVTDDRGVSSVILTYTNDSWSNSYDISMSRFLNTWAGLIPAQDNETTILFKITALDNGGNIAVNNNNSNFFYLYIISLP